MVTIEVKFMRHLKEWWVSKVTSENHGFVVSHDHETLGTFKTEAEAKAFAKKQEVNSE